MEETREEIVKIIWSDGTGDIEGFDTLNPKNITFKITDQILSIKLGPHTLGEVIEKYKKGGIVMLKLDERDIRAVATSRFFRFTQKKLVGVLVGCFAVFVGLFFLSGNTGAPIWIIFFPLAGMLAYSIYWNKEQAKFIAGFLEDWREEGIESGS